MTPPDRPTAHDRDLVIEMLAASEVRLGEEAARWRELAVAAVAALYKREADVERLRAQNGELRAQLRRFTARAVLHARSAA